MPQTRSVQRRAPAREVPTPSDVAAIIDAVSDLAIPFLGRQIADHPPAEIRTRPMTQADLDSDPVRRARTRYWVAQGYVRLLIAHQLYPARFAHPGPFDTKERLAEVEAIYARHHGFGARMAGVAKPPSTKP